MRYNPYACMHVYVHLNNGGNDIAGATTAPSCSPSLGVGGAGTTAISGSMSCNDMNLGYRWYIIRWTGIVRSKCA